MSLLSFCVDGFIGTYTFTNITTKNKLRTTEGNIDVDSSVIPINVLHFPHPRSLVCFRPTLRILKRICCYWIMGGDASAVQIWRGEGRPDKANKKTVVASTVIPPPRLTGGGDWTFMTHSIASVCRAVVCLMCDPVGWDQFGLGVSTFTFAPHDLYWGDRKHTSVKLNRVILCQVLPGCNVDRSKYGGKHRHCFGNENRCVSPLTLNWWLQPDPNPRTSAWSIAI